MTFKLFTCKDSSDEKLPCDKAKGATVTEITEAGKLEVDSTKKHGFYTPAKLEAAMWYRIEFEAKDTVNTKSFKSFVIFKTK